MRISLFVCVLCLCISWLDKKINDQTTKASAIDNIHKDEWTSKLGDAVSGCLCLQEQLSCNGSSRGRSQRREKSLSCSRCFC